MDYKLKWEKIDNLTWRTKVPNGWVMRCENCSHNGDGDRIAVAQSMVFVPDMHEDWLKEEN